MEELVKVLHNNVFTDSLVVANNFSKRHDNIIRDIESKIIGVANRNFTDLNFEVSTYKDESGKPNKMYHMTKDGFSLLAMGFTGKNAMEWKVKYINAFNAMESLLLERQSLRWQQTRLESKAARRLETDEIKEFIQYALDSGSKSADKYYIHFSKLANKAVGLDGESREVATVSQLNNLVLVENIINNCIQEGIRQQEYYKDIYKACKERIEQFRQIAYLQMSA